MAEHWLSIIEYARTYEISDMTVRRRIKTGKLKAVLKDGKYYIPQAETLKAEIEPPTRSQDPLIHFPNKPKPPSTGQNPAQPRHTAMRAYPAPSLTQNHTQSQRGDVPESIKHPLVTFETSLVNSQSLLAFCEQALNRFEDQESHLEKKHQAIIASLDSKIQFLQGEVNRYKQQVEDLQLLVKVFENKSDSPE